MLRALLLAGCLGGLAACNTARVETRFDQREAEHAMRKGTGRIEGQAFLKRDYGRVVTAAGERVFLTPATPYALERFRTLFGGDMRSYFPNAVEEPPEEYYHYRRETKVDMAGRFTFEGLAAGRYILATRVFWTEPRSYLTRGGAVYDVVDVKEGETTNAIISGK